MTTIADKLVVVTGAGSGIGRALAKALAREGARLALADIDEAGLRETKDALPAQCRATTTALDVSDREAVHGFADEVERSHGGADIVINNAGVSSRVSFEDCSYEHLEHVLGVNLWGVLHGTKAFLPHFRKRGGGHLVNIASINSIVPFPKTSPYNISKYAIYGLNETLQQEFRGQPIKVTSVHPGGIRTNIVANGSYLTDNDARQFERIARTSADQAAAVILDGIKHDRESVYIGADAKLMAAAKRLAPRSTVALVGYLTNRAYQQK